LKYLTESIRQHILPIVLSAVRSDDDRADGPEGDDTTSKRANGNVKQAGQNAHRLLYIRIARGPSISYYDPQTGDPIFDATAQDIDVSFDRKHWFHLGNGPCVHKLKKLRIEE
jgi:hypothetical protein